MKEERYDSIRPLPSSRTNNKRFPRISTKKERSKKPAKIQLGISIMQGLPHIRTLGTITTKNLRWI